MKGDLSIGAVMASGQEETLRYNNASAAARSTL
jgi:hypothetical protein